MQQQPIKLADLDIKELKALAFDLITQREELQSNLNLLLNELEKRKVDIKDAQ